MLHKSTYVFQWCRDWNWDSISTNEVTVDTKVCFAGVSNKRVYLVKTASGSYLYRPYVFDDNSWRMVFPHEHRVRPVKPDDLESQDNLVVSLELQMTLQFRDSVEGYYDTFPSMSEVCSRVTSLFTCEDLDRIHLTFYETEVQEDPEWDGAIRVLCSDGCVLYPYKEVDNTRHLLAQYATKVADSKLSAFSASVVSFVNKLTSAVTSLHWSDLRRQLDHLGGN